jgi:hypothetical protein
LAAAYRPTASITLGDPIIWRHGEGGFADLADDNDPYCANWLVDAD